MMRKIFFSTTILLDCSNNRVDRGLLCHDSRCDLSIHPGELLPSASFLLCSINRVVMDRLLLRVMMGFVGLMSSLSLCFLSCLVVSASLLSIDSACLL